MPIYCNPAGTDDASISELDDPARRVEFEGEVPERGGCSIEDAEGDQPGLAPKIAEATAESLLRVFTVPEAPNSALGRIERKISENLAGFLQEHIVAFRHELAEIERDFSESSIPEDPTFVSDHTQFLLDRVVAHSVHTSAPSFIGHMTSAIPYFMLPLSKILIALNQNLVKTETSKAFTPVERQVLGMLHRMVYDFGDSFYARHMHDPDQPIGAFCSGGTIANVTALWVARNHALGPDGEFAGVARAGLYRALRHYGYEGCAVLVSERGHYSLAKSVDLLGLGRDDVVTVPTDEGNAVDVEEMRACCQRLRAAKVKILAIVGIAGTTETGTVDPLDRLADLAEEFGAHFHVDAAWGGPVLMSERHRGLLRGIERADSVTIDAHKQLYTPMGAGAVVFRDAGASASIMHSAQYIIRRGSRDLGRGTLEGSRPGMAMLVHAALQILGRKGYELLVDQGIARARRFAAMIESATDFELVTAPQTNILTYRYVPARVQARLRALRERFAESHGDTTSPAHGQFVAIHEILNQLTIDMQKLQRERGKSFVSRTVLTPACTLKHPCSVFRVVLANPLTTDAILREVLDEQRAIARTPDAAELIASIDAMA